MYTIKSIKGKTENYDCGITDPDKLAKKLQADGWETEITIEMKKHISIYMKHFGYDTSDFIKCEIPECNQRAVDIHHINARGSGGDPQKKKDTIENLQALCRKHHIEYGDKKQFKEYLQNIHNKLL